jgi:N-formylmaleamate deformylase
MHPNWTDATIQVGGADMHYIRTGDGSKPPLVLAHGFSDSGLCWQPNAEELESQFDVILPDARGHGLSQRVARGEHVDAAGDLAAFLGTLGVKNAIVGGHSMGAATAADLGARFPDLVRALLLEDPPWNLPRPDAGARQPAFLSEENPMRAWMTGLQQKTAAEVSADCRKEHPTWPDIFIQRWGEGKQQLDLNFFTIQGPAWDRWPEVVRAIRCPVLLITSDPSKGGIITPETATEVKRLNPLFQEANIPNAGHHIRFENYSAYRLAVAGFLAKPG